MTDTKETVTITVPIKDLKGVQAYLRSQGKKGTPALAARYAMRVGLKRVAAIAAVTARRDR